MRSCVAISLLLSVSSAWWVRNETSREKWNQITISGVGSGVSMATQFNLAYSSRVMGVALFVSYVQTSVVSFYKIRVAQENIEVVSNISYGHTMPHPSATKVGEACGTNPDPIPSCDFPGAFHALNHIYGNLKLNLFRFDHPFVFGMDTKGYMYIPSGCKDPMKDKYIRPPLRRCRLHVVFHGCFQEKNITGEDYARNAGYNEVGELNNIMIMYPQALWSRPLGCWDYWWAFRKPGPKGGDQPLAVCHMIASLLGIGWARKAYCGE
ncbi:hypothetical protein CAPTEDRAFT_200927 [Capitella teleta]|uniref:ZP domain-containing protein n=1 Tax=Capitella teleta TaxID=283909 RepID=R7U332_CAPTE|nr:hypothetical protein CAPTEDRAFT_200927 [Capitella teleta]|eukprot:ELT98081.1 hypothetical protein CAPTEDRAFT_200927 [Capitella teleta]